mgnify:FL=1
MENLTTEKTLSTCGCYFEYLGEITILGTKEIKHQVRLTNPKDDVFTTKTISQNDWNGLRKFAHNYLGI